LYLDEMALSNNAASEGEAWRKPGRSSGSLTSSCGAFTVIAPLEIGAGSGGSARGVGSTLFLFEAVELST
jgi:hypothetical protein